MSNVLEMVRQHLVAGGFDGLCNVDIGCGCELADLEPCGNISSGCEAGHREPCCPDECDAGGCDFHIVTGARP